MRTLLLPLLMALVGLIGGGGIGWYLQPKDGTAAAVEVAEDAKRAYVKFPREFVIPLLEHGRVAGMVVMQLTLEVPEAEVISVQMLEPRLRDEALRVLFEHANAGGFRGNFTEVANLTVLRRALLEVSQKIAGNHVRDVLITDLARQDS